MGQTVLQLPGSLGNYASAPDSAALSITGDIDLRFRGALSDWTPAAVNILISKSLGPSQRSYLFYVDTTGTLVFGASQAGTTATLATSSVATGFADKSLNWVRVTWRNSDDRVQFFTADGSIANPVAADFIQLGTNQTCAVTGIFDSTSVLYIGVTNGGGGTESSWLTGKVYRVQIRNGIDGTLVFDADFTGVAITGSRTPNTFNESSSNAATITLNGSGWGWGTNIVVASIASGEAFGVDKLITKLLPSSIASLQAFGADKVVLVLSPGGIATLQIFGVAKLSHRLFLISIASTEAFGNPRLGTPIFPVSIGSQEAHGLVKINLRVTVVGIASLQNFGVVLLKTRLIVVSINSLEAFGILKLNLRIIVISIPSAEAFGIIRVRWNVLIVFAIGSIASGSLFRLDVAGYLISNGISLGQLQTGVAIGVLVDTSVKGVLQ